MPSGSRPLPGFKKSSSHLIFDMRITMEWKARWVKDGHKTHNPDYCTFAGVISRKSVCIALTTTALNDLLIYTCDIQNTYLQAPSSEKYYIICGPEFGIDNIRIFKNFLVYRVQCWRMFRIFWCVVYNVEMFQNFSVCRIQCKMWGHLHWGECLKITHNSLKFYVQLTQYIRW